MNDWIKHSTEFWSPDKGDELIGTITGTQSTKYGEAVKVVTGNGDTVLVNYTAINETLKDHVNQQVKLICSGEVEGDNRDYMDFEVYFKPAGE